MIGTLKLRFKRTSRTKIWLKAIIALVCGLFTISGASAQDASDAKQAGVSAAVTGEVQLARASQAVGKQIESGDPIFLQDSIESGPQASLQILLMDETVFTVGPSSQIVIDRFVYDPAQNEGKLDAQLAKGVMRFVTGKIAAGEPEDMTIDMPMGTIGIRGTMGMLAVLTPEEAQEQFPEQYVRLTGGGGGQGGFIGLAALTGPGDGNDAGAFSGAFQVDTGTGTPTQITRPNFVTLFTRGAQPIDPFRPPPGVLQNLVQRTTGGATGTGEGQYNGGEGVNTGDTQQTAGSTVYSTGNVVADFEETTDAFSSADDQLQVTEQTQGFVTLQELFAANTGSVSRTGIPIVGELTGDFAFTLDFAQRTLQFNANIDVEGGVLSDGAQALPSDSRTVLTFGSGQDFPIDSGSDCGSCTAEISFPTTKSISATIRNEGKSGTTNGVSFSESSGGPG